MKNYVRPVALVNEELAEGVYAASGDCYTFTANIHQTPQDGRGDYRIQLNGVHDAADGHHSNSCRVEIDFNIPIQYVSSGAGAYYGDGTTRLVLDYNNSGGNYHNNARDNIGLGDLVVTADLGLAVVDVKCTYCSQECGQH